MQNFNPRSPHGERLDGFNRRDADSKFQSTLPARGATVASIVFGGFFAFQSTLPARGATLSMDGTNRSRDYFNPRSPHGERHLRNSPISRQKCISIHAPRTGSDVLVRIIEINAPISIHAPRTGSDGLESVYNDHVYKFQSTLPARGATVPAPC